MTTHRETRYVRFLCPACGMELSGSEVGDPLTASCRRCGAHVLRREDHRHFVFDHREMTGERTETLVEGIRRSLVRIEIGGAVLSGTLSVPVNARGLVIFAHGSGSSRLSPRNTAVATGLVRVGLATLLFDLLTEEESVDRRLVFDIPFLAGRLTGATTWAESHVATRGLAIGYFGASTGSAAALWAAADRPSAIRAVVSRGGRPDLVDARLEQVTAPTLLIVGGRDIDVLGFNTEAAARLSCRHRVLVIPGATHLFEEAGALERAGHLAAAWFLRYLPEYANIGSDEAVDR
jgi:putative phosphoribosyl transferase